MPRKSIFAILVLVASLMAATAAAAAARGHASLLIRHQVRGCHAWSVDGGAFKATQTVKLRHGSLLVLTNNDVMRPPAARPHGRLAHDHPRPPRHVPLHDEAR